MEQDVKRLRSEKKRTQQVQLLSKWAYSFKLLGVILGCNWTFHQHFLELRGRLIKRLQALRKASSTIWGLECRILAVTTHALLESIICYGLATTGGQAGDTELWEIVTLPLNRAARRVVRPNITTRAETMLMMADVWSTVNHYIVKSENVLERT